MPYRNDVKGLRHKHKFKPIRRAKHVLTSQCIFCSKTRTKFLGDISKERVSALDKDIEANKKGISK